MSNSNENKVASKSKFFTPFNTMVVETAVIHDITQNGDNYFANVGYKISENEWQNVSVLVDSRLKSFCKKVVDGETDLEKLGYVKLSLTNISFSATENENDASKPYLANKGILSEINRKVF